MPALLTLQVVDEALENLNLKDGTLKAELAKAIRSCFTDDTSLQTITSLPTDDLVLKLWGSGSAEELRARKKNFSSLKSALNKSLKDLDRAGKNPAGIVVGRENVFSVSEERKDDLIRQLGISADSPNIFHDMLEAFRRFFSEAAKEKSAEEIRRLLASLEQTGSELRQMAGLPQEATPPATEAPLPVMAADGPSETIELLDGDEIEVVEVSAQPEKDEAREATPLFETTEILEQELLEEIAEEELLEAVDIDALQEPLPEEEVGEAEIVEIQEAPFMPEGEPDDALPEADALEVVELTEDEELLQTEEEMPEENAEEELPETAALGEIDIDDLQGLLPDEPMPPPEEVDASEIVEIQEAPLASAENQGAILPEADALEIVELSEDEELLQPEEEMAGDELLATGDLEEIDSDAPQEPMADGSVALEEVDETTIVEIEEAPSIPEGEPDEALLEAEGLETVALIEDEELLQTEEEMAEEFDTTAIPDQELIEEIAEEALPATAGLEETAIDALQDPMAEEEVDEAEIVEIQEAPFMPGGEPDDALPEADALEVVELTEDEGLPQAEEFMAGEFEGAETPDQELVEEIAEEELLEAGMDVELREEELLAEEGGGEAKASRAPTPLEILSKYIEANEALAGERELLRETQEEFINQILDRFMPKFIKIPAGVYPVGSPIPQSLEQPLRKVSLVAFYLGQSPVTNDLFDFFVRETGYVTDAEEAGYGVVYEGRCTRKVDPATGRELLNLTSGTVARHVSGANWRHPNGPHSSLEGRHNHPVVQVSHADAMAFAAWAGKRLPTEEEWEAAARGPEGSLFPWGNQWQDERGNFESSCLGATTAVDHYGRKGMGPFGIQDLLGNVAEWTATPFTAGSGADTIYILKGGSWISSGVVQASSRQIERGKHWTNTIGFRCAVSS